MAGEPKPKSSFSQRLMGMKFMQRAVERQALGKRKAEQRKQAAAAGSGGAAHGDGAEGDAGGESSSAAGWPGQAAARGCRVIVEGDPPPAAPCGRMSFRSFNPATEKVQQEAAGGDGGERGDGDGLDRGLTDEELAERLPSAAGLQQRHERTQGKKGGRQDGSGGGGDDVQLLRPPNKRRRF